MGSRSRYEHLYSGGDEEDEEDEEDSDGEEDSFDSESGNDHRQGRNALANGPLDLPPPLPREHSYLRGASHPLTSYGANINVGANISNTENNNNGTRSRGNQVSRGNINVTVPASASDSRTGISKPVELAVLELNGVVLFPGSTIPVKLRDRSLIQYLGCQIEMCRNTPHLQSEVRLGILTFQQERQLRQRLQRRQREAVGRDPPIDTAQLQQSRLNTQNQHVIGILQDEEPRRMTNHPFVGRIGTIATIQYTHERTIDGTESLSNLWERYEQGNELVFTAIGTSRFRVIGCKEHGSGVVDHRVFYVQELADSPVPLPPIQRRLLSSLPHQKQKCPKSPEIELQSQRIAWNLSMVTPVPYFVYEKLWPWKLVESLVATLETNNGRGNLPHLDFDITALEPTKFSFWMASNMPFTETERLDFLEVDSTFERLQAIGKRVEELTRHESFICCRYCHTRFTSVSNVFVVGGAEGATSNYVNGHGYIHQITTLREVDPRMLICQGNPSTENSYFPGYSWTITYCQRCGHLLGWKFLRVATYKQNRDRTDSPRKFYGFISSNVVTT